ncbi:calmodulin-binding protein 25-like [Panicum miliaceum]|uniref:Calmodulin-binding protein 25-like n=1 Tax=Panicum miliaceum TaxID=4540 RepID=A0A3L6QRJ3_PANMI|nr:calmodulin-binding protein 25-like [Panicum miliaceum]
MDAISCLAPPAALLATSFADAAIARALHFSMSSDSASSLSAPAPPLLAAAHPAAYAPHLTTCDSVLVAESPRRNHHHQQLAPAGGRAGKRRSRASKRAPTTYISTDPANFRIMVQQITGVQAEPGEVDMLLAADASAAGAYGNQLLLPSAAPGGDEAASAALHQQFQQPCFPTLDSWNVMYERSDLL